MSTYQALRLYSITAGCEILRVSMCDERGGEFFVQINADMGAKALRQKKDEALDVIMDAMERGDEPGQVNF